MTSAPPASDLASPIEETTTSNRDPFVANGGSSAVTMTAATFRVTGVFSEPRMLTPMRSSIACMDC